MAMDINEHLLLQIGEKLEELRKAQNKTQHDIEFLTGLDTAEISKYEKGKRNLTIRTLAKFALALNVHPKDLFDFDFDIEKYKIEE